MIVRVSNANDANFRSEKLFALSVVSSLSYSRNLAPDNSGSARMRCDGEERQRQPVLLVVDALHHVKRKHWDQSFLLAEKGRNCCSPACGRDGFWYYFSDASHSPVTESTTSNHVLSHDATTPQKHPLVLMVSLAVVHSHFTLLIQRSPGGWWASSFGYRS